MSKPVFTDLDFQGVSTAKNLPTPSAAGDAANKAYVDSAVEGLAWKDSCRVATQGNTNLSSPGATIDGVTMALNDRVLVRNQTTTSANGIYLWNGASTAMTRADDADTAASLEQAVVTIEEGTDAGVTYRQTAVNFTLGSGAVSWIAFGTTVPSANDSTEGKVRLATQSEVNAGTEAAAVITPATLSAWSGKPLRAEGVFGDGAATQFDFTHNWGTRAVLVEIYRNSTPWDTVLCDVERPDINTVRVRFATAPTSNQFAYKLVA